MSSAAIPDGSPQLGSARLTGIVSGLGVAQIIGWGTLYYSLAVLARPIREELGFTDLTIFGAFTAGLLASGVAAPGVGRLIDRRGGRAVMTAGSISAAVALLIVALAREPIQFTLGWILAGLATTACLYDPAFATLHQAAPQRYRRAVTGLTLFGGFASTVFWPLSNVLANALGWRWALVGFALLNLLICAPIHRFVIPAHRAARHDAPRERGAPQPSYLQDRRFWWLAASFAAATFVFSALSSFMIAALGSRGFSVEQAVWIAALIGPMQVLARVIEWLFAGRVSALTVGLSACVFSLAGMLLLSFMPAWTALGVLFALFYGASNGILTIARGIVPAALFGPQQQGMLLGALARPSFLTKALAPALFAAGTTAGFSMQTGLLLLAATAALALACMALAIRPTVPSSDSRNTNVPSPATRGRDRVGARSSPTHIRTTHS